MTAGMTVMPASSASDVPAVGSAGGPAAAASGVGATSGGPGAASDEELVEQLRDGAAAAGEQLVRRYFQPLMRYLLRIVGSDHLAEELHQQAWLSVLDHLGKFDSKTTTSGGFKAWLFRIATNKANDHWRSSSRERVAKSALKLASDDEMPPAGHRMEGTE